MIFRSFVRALAGLIVAAGLSTGASAAVIGVNCGDSELISPGDLFLGAVTSSGGPGSCAVQFTATTDPLGASAIATISVGNLSRWANLTVSWISGVTTLASSSVVAPEIVLSTLFSGSDMVQTLIFEWTNVTLPTGANAIGFDFEVSAVPIPPALLLFGSALAGVGFLSRKRKKEEPSLL